MHCKELIVIVLFGLLRGLEAGYNYDYLEENCRGNVTRYVRDLSGMSSTYGFVRPVRHGGYPRGMDCSITIKAPPGHNLILKFRKLDIYDSRNCYEGDYMTVSGNKSTNVYCGYHTPSHSLISTSDQLTIRFVSTKAIDGNTRIGFDVYYTAFHRGYCDNGGKYPTEFRCRSGQRCIPSELRCDSLDNCGDWSDERSKTCGLSTGMVICLSLVGILVGGTCCIALSMWVCAKKKERSARARRANEPVVQVEYTRGSQPPAYNGGNAALGEKPPLPAHENYGFTPDQTQFMGPPSYESIAQPAGNQIAPFGVANPTYGGQAPESIPSGNRVAPEPPVANGWPQQSAPATNQTAPLSIVGNGVHQESISVSNQVAQESSPASANGTMMSPESTGAAGVYEDVDLSANEDVPSQNGNASNV